MLFCGILSSDRCVWLDNLQYVCIDIITGYILVIEEPRDCLKAMPLHWFDGRHPQKLGSRLVSHHPGQVVHLTIR